MKKQVFKFYTDDGHGWLAVKQNLLLDLGIASQVSTYSYIKGKTVYLEEDSDASLFFKAYEAKFGTPPKYETIFHDGRSRIRSYSHYGRFYV